MKLIKYAQSVALFLMILIVSIPFIHAENLNLVYDRNGNLVTGDSFYREYDEFNQLIRVRQGNLSTGAILEEFVWHPVEERILIKDVFSNGVKNYSVYYVSKEYVLIENSTGNYSEKYVYQDGVLVAQVDTDGNKQAVHNDHLGSVSLITDSNGNVAENTFYSPFGEILEGGSKSRFDYEGKEFDSLTGDYDFHFRKFKPNIPIFNQPDTLIQNVYDPQSLNRYMFERGNPYKYTDEDGHVVDCVVGCPVEIIFFGGLIIGLVIVLTSVGSSSQKIPEKTIAESAKQTIEFKAISEKAKTLVDIHLKIKDYEKDPTKENEDKLRRAIAISLFDNMIGTSFDKMNIDSGKFFEASGSSLGDFLASSYSQSYVIVDQKSKKSESPNSGSGGSPCFECLKSIAENNPDKTADEIMYDWRKTQK